MEPAWRPSSRRAKRESADSVTGHAHSVALEAERRGASFGPLRLGRKTPSSQGRAVVRGTLDIDSFPIGVYGNQEGGAYNGYYREKIYHPIVAAFAPEGDYDSSRLGDGFVHAMLRAGNVHTASGALRFIREAVGRSAPLARSIDVRLDGVLPVSVHDRLPRLGYARELPHSKELPMPRQKKPLPAPILDALRRFESWRSVREPRERIPEELWELTAKLATEFGINRTARALRLDYVRVKRQTEARREAQPEAEPRAAAKTEFVEIPGGAFAHERRGCSIVAQDGNGAVLRIELEAIDGDALGALLSRFVQGAS